MTAARGGIDSIAAIEPAEECVMTNDHEETATTKTGAAIAASIAAGPAADEKRAPGVGVEHLANAFAFALRACPKDKDEPSVACVIIAHDPDRMRLIVAARDGRRWHLAFVTAPRSLRLRKIAITRTSARRVLKCLQFAVGQWPLGQVRFKSETNSDLLWHVHCGLPEPLAIELQEFNKSKAPEGWEPPTFKATSRDAAAASDFDSKSISEATRWPGGAICKRMAADAAGRMHVTLTDDAGEELARAVLVQRGLKDGLPKDAQTEIPGALSPTTKGKGTTKKSPRKNADPKPALDDNEVITALNKVVEGASTLDVDIDGCLALAAVGNIDWHPSERYPATRNMSNAMNFGFRDDVRRALLSNDEDWDEVDSRGVRHLVRGRRVSSEPTNSTKTQASKRARKG